LLFFADRFDVGVVVIKIGDFRRLSNFAFRFVYKLGDTAYSSIVQFVESCTDDDFAIALPRIQDGLLWLGQNNRSLFKLVEAKLPSNADLDRFRQSHIFSFAFCFEDIYDSPVMQVSYSNDDAGYEIYVMAFIKEKQVIDVKLNDTTKWG